MEIKEGISTKILTVDYIKKIDRKDIEIESCVNVPVILDEIPSRVVGIVSYVDEIEDGYIRITMNLWCSFIQSINFKISHINYMYNLSDCGYLIESVVIEMERD